MAKKKKRKQQKMKPAVEKAVAAAKAKEKKPASSQKLQIKEEGVQKALDLYNRCREDLKKDKPALNTILQRLHQAEKIMKETEEKAGDLAGHYLDLTYIYSLLAETYEKKAAKDGPEKAAQSLQKAVENYQAAVQALKNSVRYGEPLLIDYFEAELHHSTVKIMEKLGPSWIKPALKEERAAIACTKKYLDMPEEWQDIEEKLSMFSILIENLWKLAEYYLDRKEDDKAQRLLDELSQRMEEHQRLFYGDTPNFQNALAVVYEGLIEIAQRSSNKQKRQNLKSLQEKAQKYRARAKELEEEMALDEEEIGIDGWLAEMEKGLEQE